MKLGIIGSAHGSVVAVEPVSQELTERHPHHLQGDMPDLKTVVKVLSLLKENVGRGPAGITRCAVNAVRPSPAVTWSTA
jgi:hypothetical protein